MNFLLVDDERSALMSLKFGLSLHRIEAATFEEESAALATFAQDPAAFSAVVVKLAMPRIRGDLFAQRIWAIAPEIPITVRTGLSDQERIEDARSESAVCIVTNLASIAEILLSLESQGLRLPASASGVAGAAQSGRFRTP